MHSPGLGLGEGKPKPRGPSWVERYAPYRRELDKHLTNAVAKPTPREWRLVKSAEAAQIDGADRLAMAAERATEPVAKVKFHGWI